MKSFCNTPAVNQVFIFVPTPKHDTFVFNLAMAHTVRVLVAWTCLSHWQIAHIDSQAIPPISPVFPTPYPTYPFNPIYPPAVGTPLPTFPATLNNPNPSNAVLLYPTPQPTLLVAPAPAPAPITHPTEVKHRNPAINWRDRIIFHFDSCSFTLRLDCSLRVDSVQLQ